MLSLALERCISSVFSAFYLPDKYAVKKLTPTITNIFCFNFLGNYKFAIIVMGGFLLFSTFF